MKCRQNLTSPLHVLCPAQWTHFGPSRTSCSVVPAGVSLADELIEDRKKETAVSNDVLDGSE